jgi:hypothetical protein
MKTGVRNMAAENLGEPEDASPSDGNIRRAFHIVQAGVTTQPLRAALILCRPTGNFFNSRRSGLLHYSGRVKNKSAGPSVVRRFLFALASFRVSLKTQPGRAVRSTDR